MTKQQLARSAKRKRIYQREWMKRKRDKDKANGNGKSNGTAHLEDIARAYRTLYFATKDENVKDSLTHNFANIVAETSS